MPPRVSYGLVAALYLLAFPYHPRVRSPNELCRLWQARSLVEDGSLVINGPLQRYGMVGDLSVREGKYYPSKAPLMSVLAAPLYGLQRAAAGGAQVSDTAQIYWARLFLTVLPSLLLLVFLRRFLRAYLSQPVTDAVVVTYALGTLAFAYSELFMSHQLTGVLVFGAFYAAWRTLRAEWGRWGWAVAGAFSGATVACEYTGALMVLCVALYVVAAVLGGEGDGAAKVKRLLPAVGLVLLGGLPFLGALMAYHQVCFGHPLVSGYKYLNDPGYQGWHLGGFLGIRYPDPRAFVLSFFSPLRGLFMLSPVLLASLFGLKLLRARDRPLFWLTVAVWLGNAYFTSSFTYDSWGWCIGPRHLTPMALFLLLPLGLLLEKLREATAGNGRFFFGVVSGLAAVSVLVTGWLTLCNYMPDDPHTSFFGVVVPLYLDGYLPPSVLSLLGMPQPLPGALLLLLVVVAAGTVGWSLLRLQPGAKPAVAGLVAAVLVHLALLGLPALPPDPSGVGATKFLESVWLTKPAQAATY